MGYQIVDGDPTEYEVIEYPSFKDERAFHQLLVQVDEWIFSREQKERVCKKWNWDPDEVIEETVGGYVDYHLALANVVFQGEVDVSDKDRLRPGLIQEAREDFIDGCRGKSGGQSPDLSEGLMRMAESLLAQSDTSLETATEASTNEP